MKRIIAICVAVMMLASVVSAKELHSEWATDYIRKANVSGLISKERYLDDYTRPVTRQEIAELTVKAYENKTGKPVSSGNSPFSDAFNSYVTSAYNLGIMGGTGNNEFCPYQYATREEIAKIILSYKSAVSKEKLVLPEKLSADFSDFSQISDWAKPYVVKACNEGIIKGYDNGTFCGGNTVSFEEAITLVLRAAELKEKTIPEITSLNDDQIVPSNESFGISVKSDADYEMFFMKAGSYSFSKNMGFCKKGTKCNVNAGAIEPNSMYYVFAESNGVFSNPVRIYTDKYNLFIENNQSVSSGYVQIRWNSIPGVSTMKVKVTENRCSVYKDDIPPNYATTTEVTGNSTYVYMNPNRRYIVEVMNDDYYCLSEIYTESVKNDGAAEIAENYPQTKAEADKLMTTITVPVWKLRSGKKISSTASITVHYAIAPRLKLVFEEIYNGAERFPIKDVGCYSWRGGTSEHNGGTAIDINSNENYCIYSNGTKIGSYWKPYEDPYSIVPYGEVIRAFEKYGFTWGGDSWSNPKDYMHFSYLGT